jgi:5-methylcytosine-specific restriction endonuclease McrA
MDFFDNQSIISDITDNFSVSSSEFLVKQEELRVNIDTELNKLTIDGLKEKCKEHCIGAVSKLKKPELVQSLITEFQKLVSFLKDKKASDLKSICKQYNIKCNTGLKKDDIILLILGYSSANLKFKLDEPILEPEPKKQPETKGSLIEELEKQKLEIETKMKQEMAKQKKIEEEQKRLEEEQKRLEEEELKRLDDEKKREKEDAKKKKQSIPKNVRLIVWNHYIGEDIIKHRCLCCKKVVISNTNFEVGHVLSEKNGGTHEINNLRPICFACNHSMGAENMIDFVVKYGLYIG